MVITSSVHHNDEPNRNRDIRCAHLEAVYKSRRRGNEMPNRHRQEDPEGEKSIQKESFWRGNGAHTWPWV
jgi:hypothetical protein